MPITFFAPYLFLPPGIRDISFYEKAFGAEELRRWNNEDGSLHVAELAIDGCLFHVHEDKPSAGRFHPQAIKGTTMQVGLFVKDVDAVMQQAEKAGGTVLSQPETFDYGYRQGELRDPFGHVWLIQTKVDPVNR
ncbi:MAG TPA: VOC family protein [Flavisolibacter sp.]|jgi:PhnB protein|nr:VOC family protein [Flavisolibacter sp.]